MSERLRKAILRLRQPSATPFYPMREVAALFKVSVPTVARAYRLLENDGILSRVRSSMTILNARKMRTRTTIRGVVGLPVWLYGFSALQDWRSFFIQLENQLRRKGFVANFVFYQANEHGSPDFAERLLSHQLDTLLWFTPQPECVELMHSLVDGGVRVVVVTTGSYPFPFPQYVLSWERAYIKSFKAWRQSGIEHVIIPRFTGRSEPEDSWLERLIAKAGMRSSLIEVPAPPSAQKLMAAVLNERSAFLLDNDLLCHDLCRYDPSGMIQLFKKFRFLINRSLSLPSTLLREIRMDFAGLAWVSLARRIAEDLMHKRADFPASTLVHAKWFPQMDATSLAENF